MKNLLALILLFAASSTVMAQLPKVNKADLQSNVEEVSGQAELTDDQIKEALMKDEDLQEETISFLKKSPDTKNAMAKLAMGGMGASLGSSSSGLMKSILGDQNLAAAAIGFVKSNPAMLTKALKILGM